MPAPAVLWAEDAVNRALSPQNGWEGSRATAQGGPAPADGRRVRLRTRHSTAEPGATPDITVRRLRPGDEEILTHLARHNDRFGTRQDRVELEPLAPADAFAFLRDDRTATFVAFAGDDPAGFVYACELYRRHTALRHLCVYEIGVSDRYRNQGVGAILLAALGDHARAQGIERGFVVTRTSDPAAMALYAEAGGERGSGDEAIFTFTWT